MKTLVVTGGRGTRLLPATVHQPKHLLPVMNRPIIDWTLDEIERVPSLDCTILLGHHSQAIVNHLNQSPRDGITYYLDEHLQGMWSCVRAYLDELSNPDPLIVWIGDTFARVDILSLINAHRAANADLTAVVTPAPYSGIVRGVFTMKESAIRYSERTVHYGEVINLGIYIFGERSMHLLRTLTSRPRTDQFIAGILSVGHVVLYQLDSYARNINTYHDLWETNRIVLHEQLLSSASSSPSAQHPSAVIHPSTIVNEYTIVGCNAIVGAGVDIRDSIVLPNTTIPAGLALRGCVIGTTGDGVYAVRCDGYALT